MGGFFGFILQPGSGSSSVAKLGPSLAYASPAGAAVAANPLGFTTSTGRLLVTLSGNTTWISFPVGSDGQLLEIKIVAGAFILTLPATVFSGFGDLDLTLNNGVLTYYDTGLVIWERTSP